MIGSRIFVFPKNIPYDVVIPPMSSATISNTILFKDDVQREKFFNYLTFNDINKKWKEELEKDIYKNIWIINNSSLKFKVRVDIRPYKQFNLNMSDMLKRNFLAVLQEDVIYYGWITDASTTINSNVIEYEFFIDLMITYLYYEIWSKVNKIIFINLTLKGDKIKDYKDYKELIKNINYKNNLNFSEPNLIAQDDDFKETFVNDLISVQKHWIFNNDKYTLDDFIEKIKPTGELPVDFHNNVKKLLSQPLIKFGYFLDQVDKYFKLSNNPKDEPVEILDSNLPYVVFFIPNPYNELKFDDYFIATTIDFSNFPWLSSFLTVSQLNATDQQTDQIYTNFIIPNSKGIINLGLWFLSDTLTSIIQTFSASDVPTLYAIMLKYGEENLADSKSLAWLDINNKNYAAAFFNDKDVNRKNITSLMNLPKVDLEIKIDITDYINSISNIKLLYSPFLKIKVYNSTLSNQMSISLQNLKDLNIELENERIYLILKASQFESQEINNTTTCIVFESDIYNYDVNNKMIGINFYNQENKNLDDVQSVYYNNYLSNKALQDNQLQIAKQNRSLANAQTGATGIANAVNIMGEALNPTKWGQMVGQAIGTGVDTYFNVTKNNLQVSQTRSTILATIESWKNQKDNISIPDNNVFFRSTGGINSPFFTICELLPLKLNNFDRHFTMYGESCFISDLFENIVFQHKRFDRVVMSNDNLITAISLAIPQAWKVFLVNNYSVGVWHWYFDENNPEALKIGDFLSEENLSNV